MTRNQQPATGEDEAGSDQSRTRAPKAGQMHEQRTGMLHKARTLFIIVLPWVVIGLLVYVAFFIRPGSIIQSPPILPVAHGDRFYGATSVDANTLWVVGSFGKIIKSSNAGHSWVIQPSPVQSNLQSVVAWNKDDALAVGDNSTVIITSDGGRHWSVIHGVPEVSSEFNKLLQAKIARNGDVWVIGEQGTVLVSSNKGKTWTRVTPVKDITFNGIGMNEGTVWVVGEFGTILVSDDDGATWSPQVSGTDSTLTAINFSDASTGVAVGLDGTVLVTNDGGAHWGRASMPLTKTQFYAVAHSNKGWLITGDSGMFATAGLPSESWSLHSLGKSDFSWHVDALPIANGQEWLMVGSSVRTLDAGKWGTANVVNGDHS